MKVERACNILAKTQLNDYTIQMKLAVGDMVRTSLTGPGQFVHIRCGHSRLLRRPISVCDWQSSPEGDTLTIVFEVRGEGTAWLARRPVGRHVDVLGLLGNGFQVENQGAYLLVGGGIGVPPLLGCAKVCGGGSVALLGFRSKDRALLVDELAEACLAVRVATDDGSLYHHGFVDELVRQELSKNRSFRAVLACGPKPMLKSVVQAAAEFGVPCQVSMEERMACGVGACLGCAVQMRDGTMRHVCKDGPVFDAEEVDWDA